MIENSGDAQYSAPPSVCAGEAIFETPPSTNHPNVSFSGYCSHLQMKALVNHHLKVPTAEKVTCLLKHKTAVFFTQCETSDTVSKEN